MRTKCFKYIRVFIFLFVLGLSLPALGRFTAYADAPEAKLNVKSASIVKDGTFALKVYNTAKEHTVVFKSDNSEIASVSEEGVITGVSNGETVITATIKEKDTTIAVLSCNVIIGPKAISIKLTKTELTIAVGMKKTLKTILTPMTTVENAKFYSSDTTIATVSSSGRIRAKEIGDVQIFAFLENGKSAVCNVTILSVEDYQKLLDERDEDSAALDEEDEDSETDATDDSTPVPEVSGTPVASN